MVSSSSSFFFGGSRGQEGSLDPVSGEEEETSKTEFPAQAAGRPVKSTRIPRNFREKAKFLKFEFLTSLWALTIIFFRRVMLIPPFRFHSFFRERLSLSPLFLQQELWGEGKKKGI